MTTNIAGHEGVGIIVAGIMPYPARHDALEADQAGSWFRCRPIHHRKSGWGAVGDNVSQLSLCGR